MKDLTKQQNEFISKICDFESLINEEKSWIKIANIICESDEKDCEYFVWLILQVIKEQTDALFCLYGNLLSVAYEVIK